MICTGKNIIYASKLTVSLTEPFCTKPMYFHQNSVKTFYTKIYGHKINVLSKLISHGQKGARDLRIRLYLHKMWT